MANVTMEQMKTKYRSALDLMATLKVQLKNLHVQGDRMVLRAVAKTQDDANKVWDQIKRIDKNYSQDLMAEILFLSDAPAPKPQTAPTLRIHKVVAGDTLSKIAKKYYGKAGDYTKIFAANKDTLKDPDKIFPGQDLIIP